MESLSPYLVVLHLQADNLGKAISRMGFQAFLRPCKLLDIVLVWKCLGEGPHYWHIQKLGDMSSEILGVGLWAGSSPVNGFITHPFPSLSPSHSILPSLGCP